MPNPASKRYARAVFDLVEATGELDGVRTDLQHIDALLEQSPVFRHLIRHPLIPTGQRAEALKAALGSHVTPITLTFLLLLEEKGRLPLLGEMCRDFEKLYDEARGLLNIAIRSAHPLSPEQVENISGKLGKRFGRTVTATTRVDPDLVGGFVVQAGDQIFDSSAATMLERFQQQLMHA